jgi:hypothetical protein
MSIGVRTAFITTAAFPVTSSTVLVSTGLVSAVAAGQTQIIKAHLPFSVGAAGGVKLQVVVPAGGTIFNACITLNNTVAPSTTLAEQTSSVAFGDAAANAGNHWIDVSLIVVNGATAGNIDFQMAQNSSNGTAMTLLRGASLDIIKL